MGRPKLDSTTLTVRLLPATLRALGPEPSRQARIVLEAWAGSPGLRAHVELVGAGGAIVDEVGGDFFAPPNASTSGPESTEVEEPPPPSSGPAGSTRSEGR